MSNLRGALYVDIFKKKQLFQIYDETSFLSKTHTTLTEIPDFLKEQNDKYHFKFVRLYGDKNLCNSIKEKTDDSVIIRLQGE